MLRQLSSEAKLWHGTAWTRHASEVIRKVCLAKERHGALWQGKERIQAALVVHRIVKLVNRAAPRGEAKEKIRNVLRKRS